MPIGAAIIGCGVIAPTHAAALALDQRARLRWAVDPDQDAARRLGADAVSGDWRRALEDPAVDLVCICLPHHLHAEVAVAALAAGKHVWCEKPLATAAADLDRMIAAVPAGRVASGVFQHRFDPLVRRLRQLIAQGDFGAVRRVDVRFRCTRTAEYYRSGPWRGTWAGEGGALLINQAIHTIDLGVFLAGSHALAVRGTVERRRDLPIEAEDTAQLSVDLAGGATMTIDAANDGVTTWDSHLTLELEHGRVALGNSEALLDLAHPNAVLMAELHALAQLPVGARMPGKADYGHHHALQAADVLNAIAAGHAPAVTFADAAVTNRLVLSAYALCPHLRPALSKGSA